MSSVQITRYFKKKSFTNRRSEINIKQSLRRDTRNGISMSCQGNVATKIYQRMNESLKGTTNFIKQSRMDHLTPLLDVLNFHRFFIKRGGGYFVTIYRDVCILQSRINLSVLDPLLEINSIF